MLATANRLRRPDDFRRTVRQGRRSGGALLVVHLLVDEPPQAPAPRAGFVVARSVGSAVTRNLVKRRLRHLVRDALPGLPPGALLVVRAQPAAAGASQAELAVELALGLERCLKGPRKGGQKRAQTRGERR